MDHPAIAKRYPIRLFKTNFHYDSRDESYEDWEARWEQLNPAGKGMLSSVEDKSNPDGRVIFDLIKVGYVNAISTLINNAKDKNKVVNGYVVQIRVRDFKILDTVHIWKRIYQRHLIFSMTTFNILTP